ncbi:Uncharacterized conserved protein YraI [Pseudoxanthobacter soli DSM 19599]|uniref:Uncharacterized conserved protein YraI n=1 Tax=Pseudoxanthobacter soli DSM 19599 TaxID=1123029 RepID=A0A1M7Z462_9HYPH|nr:SH3 domain-containing protein [Pseudoxanthobacter soli]SHO59733.1 Uncharacterized conserved protein YraI [Pseudoxanthobacter soli DSM 19599]
MTTRHWAAGALVAAAFALAPTAASAQTAGYSTGNVYLRAGPGTQYPAVGMVQKNARLAIFGCVSGYVWCDVAWGGSRGWMSGKYLQASYQNQMVEIPSYATALGLPIIGFSVGNYWDNYYRTEPWYGERAWWMNNPNRPPPPNWRPPGGGYGPGGPPPPGGWNRPPPPPPPPPGGWNNPGWNNPGGPPPPPPGGWNRPPPPPPPPPGGWNNPGWNNPGGPRPNNPAWNNPPGAPRPPAAAPVPPRPPQAMVPPRPAAPPPPQVRRIPPPSGASPQNQGTTNAPKNKLPKFLVPENQQ